MKSTITKYITLLVLISSLFIAGSCYYDSDEWLYGGFEYQCDTTDVTYTESIKPLLGLYCFACHSNARSAAYGDNITLEDYDNLKILAGEGILTGAINHNPDYSKMPKDAAKLDPCKIRTIEIWVEQGAPNN